MLSDTPNGPAPASVHAEILLAWLQDGEELALLDAREQGVYFESHLFHAASVPLSSLELDLEPLVPRKSTRMVWCDRSGAADGLAATAARRAAALGWNNCHVLEGGIDGWAANGGELYAGINVPSKAFGEFVEHTYDTPRIPAPELQQLLDADEDGEPGGCAGKRDDGVAARRS